MKLRFRDPYHVFKKGKGKSKLEQRLARENFVFKHMFSESNWRKIKRNNEAKIDRALSVKICPKCDSRIKTVVTHEGALKDHGKFIYICEQCGFEHRHFWDDMDDPDGYA